jgi:hypothetical protein
MEGEGVSGRHLVELSVDVVQAALDAIVEAETGQRPVPEPGVPPLQGGDVVTERVDAALAAEEDARLAEAALVEAGGGVAPGVGAEALEVANERLV